MLTETGRVVAVERDSVWVETIRQSTCGGCAVRQGCGHSLLNRRGAGKQGYIRVLAGKLAAADCKIDDQVRIGIPAEVILRGSLIVYLLPLLTLLAGAALMGALVPASGASPGQASAGQDLLPALGAVLGFMLGVGLVRWHAWHHRDDQTLQPTLLARIQPAAGSLQLL